MSLVYCPECGHEISANAIACPNCGLPLSARPPVVEEIKKPVASAAVVTRARGEGLPPWAIPVFAVSGILLLVILFLLFRGSNEDTNTNVNLAMNARRQAEANRELRTASVPPGETSTQTVPGSQVSMPTTTTSAPPTETTVPGTTTAAPVAPPPDKGTVAIKARVITPRGGTQPARSARFYLLDKDVETILNEAHVQPIEGNTIAASLGLAMVHPDQYGEFQRAAMRAISAHAKYTGTTGSDGSARIANIAPKEYYLFAITKVGNGFALWDSPVSVEPGDNLMDLSPASVTEIES